MSKLMKEKKEKKKENETKQKKKFMTPQKYTIITIIFLGIIVAIGIYSNIANWSGQKDATVEVIHNYNENVVVESKEKVIGQPNGFNNTFVVDIFNNQIWLNNVILLITLLLCFIVLPVISYYVGKKLSKRSVIVKLIYLIITSLIDLIFYFWLPIALIMIFINYISYKRGLNSIGRKKEKKSEFSIKK